MKVMVPLKRVPDYTARLYPDGNGGDDSNVKMIIKPFDEIVDEIALEETMQLKKKGSKLWFHL